MWPSRRSLAAIACSALVTAAVGCGKSSGPPPVEQKRQPLVVEPRRVIEPAGLVALDRTAQALTLGGGTRTTTDRALSNGDVPLGQAAILKGNAEARLKISLQSNARLEGNAKAGGTITVASGAVITGTRTPNATVPVLEFPSTDEFLAAQGASFGSLKPDIVLGASATLNLAAGGTRVARVVLSPSSKIVVSGVSALQADTIEMGSSSQIVVRPDGRLILHVKRLLLGGSDAKILQETPAKGRGLIVALAPAAFAQLGPLARFGPGLIYGHDRTWASPPRFEVANGKVEGALAVGQINATSGSELTLSSRYLACASGFTTPMTITLQRPITAEERQPPAGTTSVPVAGIIAPMSIFEKATISDGVSQRNLTVGSAGAFTTTATLRNDGTATSICVVARDCLDRDVTSCTLVAPQAPLQIRFTSPSPGQVVSVGTLNVTGRVEGGTASKISIGSRQGSFLGNAFTIPGVPLQPGLNTLVLEAESMSGQKVQRRLTVSRGAMAVVEMALEIDPNQNVRVLTRTPRAGVGFAQPTTGSMSYRLVDTVGVELYRGTIPSAGRYLSERITPTGEIVSADPQSFATADVTVPAVPGATRIEFLNEDGRPVGSSAL